MFEKTLYLFDLNSDFGSKLSVTIFNFGRSGAFFTPLGTFKGAACFFTMGSVIFPFLSSDYYLFGLHYGHHI